jgi:release factor glutamine methyltransferase
MLPRAVAGPPTATPTRRELVAELAEVVGALHEARFIVDEAVGGGADTGRSDSAVGPVAPEAVASARAMAARRSAGEPLQYVFGHWSFRTLDLLVDQRVLIPRPETEQVVEVALGEARRLHDAAVARSAGFPGGARGLVAVDVGTGTGAIALSLASELGSDVVAEVWAVDASADALAVASSNLDAVRARNCAMPTVSLVSGDWLDPLPVRLRGAVDLVVCNPPYVSEDEWVALHPVVRAEPRQALVSGPGRDGTPGFAGIEAVLVESLVWLAGAGVVVVELAPPQADPAARLAGELGYVGVRVEPDLAGRARTLVAHSEVPE